MYGMGEEWYGHKSYTYTPKWDTQIERHPDKLRSSSMRMIESRGDQLVMLMEVQGLGVITLTIAKGDIADPKGRIRCDGIGIFTKEELLFD